jgi:hypothetical protein
MTAPRRRRRRPPGPTMALAFAHLAQVRADFHDHVDAQYDAAEHDTRGNLLNARGRHHDIDPRSLFYGPAARVTAYASDELLDWVAAHGRTTFAEYERARTEHPA